MIKAIIVDDEKDGAEVLQFLIQQNCSNIQILSLEHSVESAISAIQKHKPDLVFMDIEMPTGTGFDVIQNTNEIGYETIFITAYEHYAIKAFKTNAIDYLLKPVDVDELINAVKNAEKRINTSNKNNNTAIEALILNAIQKSKKIAIPSHEGILWVDLDDLIRFEADSNYTHVYIKDKKKMTIAKTLKSFEDQLPNSIFCRVHSAHLVNLNEIEKYIKGDGGIVVLKDNSNIPVSRANKAELLTKLNLYL
ncbi:MAG: response regulator transcription factor [Bacteroidia bacterium]|nr:response regulator transcription factor [Bacteroidia bacterium]